MGWGGAFGGGQNSTQANRAAGLPFAGIPPELLARVKKIRQREPEHPEPDIDFRPDAYDREPFTLWRFLAPHRMGLLTAFALVVVATLASLAGPRLTAWAIDHGILKNDMDVLIWCFVAYVAAILVSMGASYARIRYTGRLGHKLMYELRVKVFSHMQRLSLD